MKTTFLIRSVLVLAWAGVMGCNKPGDTATDAGPVDITVDNVPAPQQPKAEVVISGVTQDEEVSLLDMLHVTGLLTRGTQQVAIINGNVVTMGEDMYLDTNLHRYKMQVLSIKGNVIKLKAEVAEDGPTPL